MKIFIKHESAYAPLYEALNRMNWGQDFEVIPFYGYVEICRLSEDAIILASYGDLKKTLKEAASLSHYPFIFFKERIEARDELTIMENEWCVFEVDPAHPEQEYFRLKARSIFLQIRRIKNITYYHNKVTEIRDETRDMVFRQKSISEKDKAILNLLRQGHTDQEIAEWLYLPLDQVEFNIQNLEMKFGVKTRKELVLKTLETLPESQNN